MIFDKLIMFYYINNATSYLHNPTCTHNTPPIGLPHPYITPIIPPPPHRIAPPLSHPHNPLPHRIAPPLSHPQHPPI